ncbi:MAG: FKBP-type peptidyl-prolyl cis-trans isomerase [Nanoarchaeota archaeon]
MTETIKQGDFVEIKFTGFVDGKPFDSNIDEDLKKINSKAKSEKTTIIVGKEMVVKGLDKEFAGKEFNKEYRVAVSCKEGFGPRYKELIRTIPLNIFTQQKITPKLGASFVLDNQLAKVIAVSGARVITDFNNPLAGKDLEYKFIAVRTVTDLKEKAEAVCKLIIHFVPKIEIENNNIIIRGPKILENIIKHSEPDFKNLLNSEIHFKESAPEKAEETENTE